MARQPVRNPHPRQIAWFVLALLLFLRIPFTLVIIYFLPIENQLGGAIYEVSTYLLTAFLIWWECHQLAEFHIDTSALCLIIFLRPLQTLILTFWHVDSPLAFPRPFGVALWLIALGVGVSLWRSGYKPALPARQALGWLVVGALAGICISMAENLGAVGAMLANLSHPQAPLLPMLFSTSLNLVYHLGFAPINEEPLFRGFLWGYLRQAGWRERSIWLFQAALFTLAHAYFARQFPFMFWVLIPGAALVFGALTWRTRSIAPAMLAHGLINGSTYLLVFLLFRLLV